MPDEGGEQVIFPPCLQVKQHVAVVKNARGLRFRVFVTGDPRFYLFSAIAPDGSEGALQFPVRKTDLRPDIRRAFANGWGNSN